MVTQISSTQNLRIKEVIRLRERRERDRMGFFLIEGYRELRRAVDAGYLLKSFFYAPSLFLGEQEEKLLADSGAEECFLCTSDVFRKISYRDRPDGLLAVAYKQPVDLSVVPLSSVPFFLIAGRIEKPGNLGSILRSCDAVGVDAVLVCDPVTDIYNPNVVRSSVGTLFTQPVVVVNSADALACLRRHQISIVSATPRAAVEYTQVDLTGPIAIAVGAEQIGLSDAWMNHASMLVRIPMRGSADSLNVAAATTLLLYEVLRQRTALLRSPSPCCT